MKRVLLALAALAAAAVVVLAGMLALAHREIDGLEPALPTPARLAAVRDKETDLPVRLAWLDTADQAMPRAAVLEPSLDPTPDADYVMAHTSFVVEWADGRLLLVDLGMDEEATRAFGRPLELLAGAEPPRPYGSAAQQLGPAARRVAAIVFTHLHTDHTQGGAALCAARASDTSLPVFQGPLQAERTNHTTQPGRAQIEAASCLAPRTLEGEPPLALPGFPGVAIVPVAGHTPGSQVVVVQLGGGAAVRRAFITGDVVNHMDGLRLDLPKPRLYGLLVVPESPERLAGVRRYLRGLMDEHGYTALVGHDRHQLASSGVPAWRARP